MISLQSAGPGILELILETTSAEAGGTASQPDTIDTLPAHYAVNGQPPIAIHRYSVPWHEEPVGPDGRFPVTVRHHLYLRLGGPLQEGRVYALTSPWGTGSLAFGSKTTLTSCLKVNQMGYAGAATVRFANLGVWLGDGGTISFDGLPAYQVIRESDGSVLFSGTAVDLGADTGTTGPKSGEHVYRLDLSVIPEGGLYFVAVPGVGRSQSFGIGQAYTRQAARVSLLGMTIARSGQELKPPWSHWTRAAGHLQAADTRAPWSASGFIQVPTGAIMKPRKGGRYDAADYDLRPYHHINATALMTYYEGWPTHLPDRSVPIPEAGNGIPVLLNEALWDVLGWESLQVTEPSDPQYGGVRSGIEECAHPTYGVHRADADRCAYGTWGVDGPAGTPAEGVTAYVAGVFAQASRLIRRYDAARADDLLRKARRAWSYHDRTNGVTAIRAYNLYASLQLYLVTGEAPYDLMFKAQAHATLVGNAVGPWPHAYLSGNYGESGAQIQTVHFASYTLPQSQSVDTGLVDAIKTRVIREADRGGYSEVHPLTDRYPVAANRFIGWGALTAPGRFDAPAWASLYTADAAKRRGYINTMSVLADGVLGLNAMGMSYVVGLGTDQPNSPLHCDSYFAQKETGKLLDGVMVFGPSEGRSGANYQTAVTNKLWPAWENLPIARRYAHGWSAVNLNEDAPTHTRLWFATLMAFLHDASRDAPPSPPVPVPPTPDGIQLTAAQTDALRRVVAYPDDLKLLGAAIAAHDKPPA
jgi:endoglucanase